MLAARRLAQPPDLAPVFAAMAFGAGVAFMSCDRAATGLPLLLFCVLVLLFAMQPPAPPAAAVMAYHQDEAEQKAEPKQAADAPAAPAVLTQPFHMDFLQARASHASGSLHTAPAHDEPLDDDEGDDYAAFLQAKKGKGEDWSAWEDRLAQAEPQSWLAMFDAGVHSAEDADPFAGFVHRV